MSTRTEILELLTGSDPLRPSEVATRLALPYERVKKQLQRMTRAGEVIADNGRYSFPRRDTTARHGDMQGVRVRLAERDEWENTPTFWIA